MKLSIALVVILASASFASAQSPTLTSITLNSGTSILGEVRSENAVTAQVFDLSTGDEKTIKIADIKSRTSATDTTAILRVGLPRFLAWRVKKELNGPATGKIAEVTPSSIYLTLGSKDGIEVGSTLTVFRDEGELKDPDTGDVIGRKRAKLARLEITEVQDSYSKAKRLGDTDVELKVKDQVEQEGVSLAVAIMPILDIEGDETTTGKTLAEQISTMFVSRGITVVERERLNVALTELALQQSKAFDADAAQKVGKQLGAVAVVTGTITPKAMRAEAHVRLIRVQTGEAIIAASQDVAAVGNKVAGAPQSAVTGAGATVKIDATMLKNKFAGKASYNSKTGELTFVYDFTANQLVDFEPNVKDAKLPVASGVLKLESGITLRHRVPFETFVMTCEYFPMDLKNQKPFQTSEGVWIGYDPIATFSLNYSRTEEYLKSGVHPRGNSWAAKLDVAANHITMEFGGAKLTRWFQNGKAGQLELQGGKQGAAYRKLTIQGVPDAAWVAEFFGK